MSNEVFVGSGNVFADAEIPEAEERLRKAPLALAIRKAIDKEGLTQTEAAERMGLRQPEVSRIVRGRLSGFTMERLFDCLVALGRSVDVYVSDTRDEPRGHLQIHYAATSSVCTCGRRVATT